MADVATLGLRIDSSQAKAAATDLDRMTAAAGRASTSTDKLAKQSGLARHELVNLSRQVQDIGVSLASGQSPFTVLIQQGTQVADIFGTSSGTMGGFGRQLASVVTPARLLSTGLIGIGVGAAFAFKSIADNAKQFDDVARSVNTTTGALHGLQQAAAFKGIGQDDFFSGAKKFGDALYDAQHNMGTLGEFLRANGQTAGNFQQTLEKVADLIKNAGSDQERLQLLQRAGLPATMEWVRFLSQGAEGIRQATSEAVKFNDSAEGKLIASARKFDEAWAKTWSNWSNSIKSALLNGLNSLDDFTFSSIDKFKKLAANSYGQGSSKSLIGGSQLSGDVANSFYDAVGMGKSGGGTKKPVDPNVLRNQISLEQQAISIRAQLGSVTDVVRGKELEIAAARLNGVSISKSQADSILLITRAQAEMTRVNQQASVGIYDMSKAQQAANDNLKALVAQGLLDPKNPAQWAAANEVAKKSLEQLSNQAAIAGSKFEQLKRYQLDSANSRSLFDGFAVRGLDTFTNALADVVTGAKTAKQAFSEMAKSIINDLVKIAIRQAITGPIAGAISAGFGIPIPKFAGGTNSAPGGMALVGEKGPELVNLPRGARVFSNDNTKGMLGRSGGVSFGDTQIVVNGNADEYGIGQIRNELAAHRRLLANMSKQSAISQRLSATGVG